MVPVNKDAMKPTPACLRPSTALSINLAGNLAKGLLFVLSLQVHFCEERGRPRTHATRFSGFTAPRGQAIADRVAVLVNASVMQCMLRTTKQQVRCAKHKDDVLMHHPACWAPWICTCHACLIPMQAQCKCFLVTLSTLYPTPHPRTGIHLPVSI